MLAVLEHVQPAEQPVFAAACAKHLRPGGLLVVTTPAPAVDLILDVLTFLRLIDGMSLEQHYGFICDCALCKADLRQKLRQRSKGR